MNECLGTPCVHRCRKPNAAIVSDTDCILHVGGVLLLEWLVQSRDQTDQSASTTLSCENVYSVKLFDCIGVETVLWESNEDRCNWDASNYDMQCALMWMPQCDNFFSYGNFKDVFAFFSALMQACCSQPCCSAHWYGMGWWHCMIAQMMSMSFAQITSRRWCWTVTLCGWWSSMHLGKQLLHALQHAPFTQLWSHLGYSSAYNKTY